MNSFFAGIWTRIKAVFSEVEVKIVSVWKWNWTLVETVYAAAQKLIISLGEVHAAALVVLAWGVYFLFARGLVSVSTDLVASLVKAIPVLVVLALVAATAIVIMDIINKKKQ